MNTNLTLGGHQPKAFRLVIIGNQYPMRQSYPLIFKATAYLIFGILLIFSLMAARNFLYPIALSVLFAYLLYPFTHWLEKGGIPRIVANLSGILLALLIIFVFLLLLYKQLSLLLDDIPQLMRQAQSNLYDLHRFVENKTGIATNKQHEWLKTQVEYLFASGSAFIKAAFAATTGTIVKLGLMPVYIFFLLYYRDKFAHFLLMIVPRRHHDRLEETLLEISLVTKRYMNGVVIVVAILCVLNSIGLLIVGVKFAVLLGVISALMNFIPYFGTLIGGAVPLTFSLLMMDSPKFALGVLILFIIIQFTENNILTPNIVGGNVNVNPFFTILSIIVGGMIWGLPGMIISLPFMSIFRIVCSRVPKLRPVAYLLGTRGTEKHAISLQSLRKLWRNTKNFFHPRKGI